MPENSSTKQSHNACKPMLADGLSADNPFRKIIGWYVGDIERHMNFDATPYTKEQLQEFRNNYSECMYCNQWYKDTDFSSFCLGAVICKRCDV
jgi:hypothetical protein